MFEQVLEILCSNIQSLFAISFLVLDGYKNKNDICYIIFPPLFLLHTVFLAERMIIFMGFAIFTIS